MADAENRLVYLGLAYKFDRAVRGPRSVFGEDGNSSWRLIVSPRTLADHFRGWTTEIDDLFAPGQLEAARDAMIAHQQALSP